MAYSINFLSACRSGEPIQITGTNSAQANAIHTGIAGTTQIDEVFLYVNNSGSQFYPLVIQMGAQTPAHELTMWIATQDSPQLILPGWPINNSAFIRGYSPSGINFSIGGYVQRGP